MPYPHHIPLALDPPKPSYLPLDDVETLQLALDRMQQERDSWMVKYQIVATENVELRKLEIEDRPAKKMKVQENLFSSGTEFAHIPPTSGVWKSVVDKLVIEKL